MVTDIERFGLECERLYDGKAERATLEPFEPELRINVEATDRLGHMRADVEITPDHLAQTHRIQFEIDQSYLPAIIGQCAARGASSLSSRPSWRESNLRRASRG